MWETICDAKASRKWQGKICAQIGKNTLFWDLVQKPHPHPPKLKFSQILALWVLTGTEHDPTPSPTPLNWNLARSWHFAFWVVQTGLQLEYVETNCCIPQGYHLVSAVITSGPRSIFCAESSKTLSQNNYYLFSDIFFQNDGAYCTQDALLPNYNFFHSLPFCFMYVLSLEVEEKRYGEASTGFFL